MTVRVRTRAIVAGALLTATTLLAVGCGSSDNDNNARPVVHRAPVKAAQPQQTLRFTATEYAFKGPKVAEAGLTKLVLTNKGLEDHQLGLFRMNGGVEVGTVLAAVGAKGLDAGSPFGHFVGGPNGTGPAATTSDVAELVPGKYIVLCGIPDASGTPHAMKGMLSDLTVTAAKTATVHDPAGLPELRLGDYSFELPSGFDGSGPLVVVNHGGFVHEAVVARIADGKTVDDIIEYESQPFPRTGAAPYTNVDGTTFIAPGGRARLDLALPAGKYTWLCFLPGPDKKPHLALGMAHPFTVS